MNKDLNTIKKLFVSKELAAILKEKGFNIPVIATYDKNGILTLFDYEFERSSELIAPLFSQVTDWLREKHYLHIEVELTDNTKEYYFQYTIVDSKNREYHDEDLIDQASSIIDYKLKSNTYYESLNEAILKALTLIK